MNTNHCYRCGEKPNPPFVDIQNWIITCEACNAIYDSPDFNENFDSWWIASEENQKKVKST